jgi:hypothetical protein
MKFRRPQADIDKEIMEQAFTHLFPHRDFSYNALLLYSGRFSAYNANITLQGNRLQANLCKKWKRVSPEIKMGLLQDLYLKMWKRKGNTTTEIDHFHLDLYNNFLRNLHLTVEKKQGDSLLEASFARINERYFLGMVDKPNLEWGRQSTTKLGSYDFKIDSISISTVFKDLVHEDPAFLDVVMYHEMLHKVHKYRSKNGRNCYHDSKFRKAEEQFENFHAVDGELKRALGRVRRRRAIRHVAGRSGSLLKKFKKLF